MEERRTYVCKRARLCDYLMKLGFMPYRVKPSRENPRYNVFLFTATPELYKAVLDYVKDRQLNKDKGSEI